MNLNQILSIRDKAIGYIRKSDSGKLSLNQIKEIYKCEHSQDFPFGENGDEHIHEIFKDFPGIKFHRHNGEIFYAFNEKCFLNDGMSGKRKVESPPQFYNSTPSKRSRSVPDNESDNDINKENHPFGRGRARQQNRGLKVTFQDHKEKIENAPRSKSEHRPKKFSTGLTSFQNCVLIGDDFLLGFCMVELKQKPVKKSGVLQSGLCISGLTIKMATEKLREIKSLQFDKAIVYLGSFDIVNGKELIELMNDYESFVEVCKMKKINAVACTLAPLPRHEEGNRKATLEAFNKFLKTKSGLSVIDVNKIFCGLKKEESINIKCYMDHRPVSGSKKHVTLWSVYGIQEFRRTVIKNVGFALVADKPLVL